MKTKKPIQKKVSYKVSTGYAGANVYTLEPKEVSDTGCEVLTVDKIGCNCPDSFDNVMGVTCPHRVPTKTSWENDLSVLYLEISNKNTNLYSFEKLKQFIQDLLTTQREEIKKEVEKLDKGEVINLKGNKYEFYRVDDVLELLSKE
jgi:hypothetical protein